MDGKRARVISRLSEKVELDSDTVMRRNYRKEEEKHAFFSSKNRMEEEEKGSLKRYEKLKLRDQPCILTEVYSKLPKNLQAVILDDVIAAFRLLPQ
ncbi:hypothetical protein AKJ16_DCAP23018 [Drosera capensis]